MTDQETPASAAGWVVGQTALGAVTLGTATGTAFGPAGLIGGLIVGAVAMVLVGAGLRAHKTKNAKNADKSNKDKSKNKSRETGPGGKGRGLRNLMPGSRNKNSKGGASPTGKPSGKTKRENPFSKLAGRSRDRKDARKNRAASNTPGGKDKSKKGPLSRLRSKLGGKSGGKSGGKNNPGRSGGKSGGKSSGPGGNKDKNRKGVLGKLFGRSGGSGRGGKKNKKDKSKSEGSKSKNKGKNPGEVGPPPVPNGAKPTGNDDNKNPGSPPNKGDTKTGGSERTRTGWKTGSDRSGGSGMGRIAENGDQFIEAVKGVNMDNAQDVEKILSDAAAHQESVVRGLNLLSRRLTEEFPTDPAVPDQFQGAAQRLRGTASEFSEFRGLFRRKHSLDYERFESPRTQEHKMDYRNNQG